MLPLFPSLYLIAIPNNDEVILPIKGKQKKDRTHC